MRSLNFSTPITEDTYLKALFVDPRDLGNDRFEIEIRDGAPKVDVDDVVGVVVATLTQAELDADYSLLLVSSPLADVPSPDKDVLEGQVKALGATPGTWFDISLCKVQGDEQTKLSKAGTPMKMQVVVPESLRKEGRTFYLLRCHDGKATIAVQGTGDVLKWETDEFFTYLIAYADSAPAPDEPAIKPVPDDPATDKPVSDSSASSKSSSDGSTSGKSTPNGATSSTPVAKTDDPISAGIIGVVLVCSAIALAAAGIALRRRNGRRS